MPRFSPRGVWRAHPRSRGENSTLGTWCPPTRGSSPLTRGKQRSGLRYGAVRGLIPAHAGKTIGEVAEVVADGAHPRSCGENPFSTSMAGRGMGSSPLTRGKRTYQERVMVRAGLIPAHAGKTPPRTGATRPTRAHPRSRGENVGGDPQELPNLGSSPLTRGKPRPRHPEHVPGVAHPRSRGENAAWLDDLGVPPGSSPLTRGKPVDQQAARRTNGLIPAHAGKT